MKRWATLALVVVSSASVIVIAVVAVSAGPGRAPTQPPPRAMPIGNEPSDCASCHEAVLAHDTIHGPLRLKEHACAACHTLVDTEQHAFELAETEGTLCRRCHDTAARDAAAIHAPFAQDECLVCHGAHGGNGPAILTSASAAALCRDCHGVLDADAPYRHAPVGEGDCSACHDPHLAPFESLLVGAGPPLCLGCHEEQRKEIDGALHVHAPVLDRCEVCHDPHASDRPALLRLDAESLCASCHDPLEHAGDLASGAPDGHRNCLDCHDAHASEHESLLVREPAALCLSCHDRPLRDSHGTWLDNTDAELRGARHLHGPVASGECGSCHRTHGDGQARLLVDAYPAEFYAPYARERYALCFGCHDSALVEAERTTDATGFRDGDRNLHFVHVAGARQGRTCRACHATHGSRREHLLRETVPFGNRGWELAIGFTSTPAGGRCTSGCHETAGYDRGPHATLED